MRQPAVSILKPLVPGALVEIVAPSGAFDRTAFDAGVAILREAGFRVRFDESIFSRERYLAGSDDVRLAPIRRALADPEVAVVWCARGGYGAGRIAAGVAEALVKATPRWLVGFSDPTVLHGLWAAARVPSLHGANVTTLATWSPLARSQLFDILWGRAAIELEGVVAAGSGVVNGPLLGGNITLLASMVGTSSLPNFSSAIVALEDVGERPYRIDRCLTQLFRSGAFRDVAAFVVGQLTDCREANAEFDALDVVRDTLAQAGVPVATGFPFGHEPTSHPIIFGRPARVTLSGRNALLNMGELRSA